MSLVACRRLSKALFHELQQLLNIGKCRGRVVVEINELSFIALVVRRGLSDHTSRLPKCRSVGIEGAGYFPGRLRQSAVEAKSLRVCRAVKRLLPAPLHWGIEDLSRTLHDLYVCLGHGGFRLRICGRGGGLSG